MKPEHLDWVDQIWERLQGAVDEIAIPKSAAR